MTYGDNRIGFVSCGSADRPIGVCSPGFGMISILPPRPRNKPDMASLLSVQRSLIGSSNLGDTMRLISLVVVLSLAGVINGQEPPRWPQFRGVDGRAAWHQSAHWSLHAGNRTGRSGAPIERDVCLSGAEHRLSVTAEWKSPFSPSANCGHTTAKPVMTMLDG